MLGVCADSFETMKLWFYKVYLDINLSTTIFLDLEEKFSLYGMVTSNKEDQG